MSTVHNIFLIITVLILQLIYENSVKCGGLKKSEIIEKMTSAKKLQARYKRIRRQALTDPQPFFPLGVKIALNVPIPTNIGFFPGSGVSVDQCPRSEIQMEDGSCHNILTSGNCEIQEEILLDPTSKVGYCAPKLCPPDRVFLPLTQMCHDPRDTNVCPPGRELYYSSFGTAICTCPDGTVEGDDDLDDDVCELVLGKSLQCLPGQIFWFRNFQSPPECLPDPCNGMNLNRQPNSLPYVPDQFGNCFQLGQSEGVCPKNKFYTLKLVELRGECLTLQEAGFNIFNEFDLQLLKDIYGPTIDRNSRSQVLTQGHLNQNAQTGFGSFRPEIEPGFTSGTAKSLSQSQNAFNSQDQNQNRLLNSVISNDLLINNRNAQKTQNNFHMSQTVSSFGSQNFFGQHPTSTLSAQITSSNQGIGSQNEAHTSGQNFPIANQRFFNNLGQRTLDNEKIQRNGNGNKNFIQQTNENSENLNHNSHQSVNFNSQLNQNSADIKLVDIGTHTPSHFHTNEQRNFNKKPINHRRSQINPTSQHFNGESQNQKASQNQRVSQHQGDNQKIQNQGESNFQSFGTKTQNQGAHHQNFNKPDSHSTFNTHSPVDSTTNFNQNNHGRQQQFTTSHDQNQFTQEQHQNGHNRQTVQPNNFAQRYEVSSQNSRNLPNNSTNQQNGRQICTFVQSSRNAINGQKVCKYVNPRNQVNNFGILNQEQGPISLEVFGQGNQSPEVFGGPNPPATSYGNNNNNLLEESYGYMFGKSIGFGDNLTPAKLTAYITILPSGETITHVRPPARNKRDISAGKLYFKINKLLSYFNSNSTNTLNIKNANFTHVKTLSRSKRDLLSYASPSNVYENRLASCKAGAKRGINAKCKETVLPSRVPKQRGIRAAPPIHPTPRCPAGTVFNIRRRCEPTDKAQNSFLAINLK